MTERVVIRKCTTGSRRAAVFSDRVPEKYRGLYGGWWIRASIYPFKASTGRKAIAWINLCEYTPIGGCSRGDYIGLDFRLYGSGEDVSPWVDAAMEAGLEFPVLLMQDAATSAPAPASPAAPA